MSAASNYLENELLDHVLRFGNGSLTVGTGFGYAAPSVVYVALFAATAGETGALATALESGTNAATAGNHGYYEVTTSGTAYARQSITFAAAGIVTTGQIASNATVTFPVATADYDNAAASGATVRSMALMDASTGGNVLFYGALTNSKTVNSGDQFTISSGNLTVSLA
jgi:hypothetical protein